MCNIHERIFRQFPAVAAVLLVSLIGCKQAPDPVQKSTPAAMEAVKPKRQSLPRVVEQPGTIQAYEETHLYARVSGYVKLPRDAAGRILSDIGRKVKGPKFDKAGKEIEPGDILAELAVPELEQEVKQKQALIRQANAEVDQHQKALAAAEANIAAMSAVVDETKALKERCDSEFKRIDKLVKENVVASQARDETENQLKAAVARVVSAEAAVRKAKADRDKGSADVKAAEAKVDVAKAEASRAETMLGYAKIRAPYDGIVIARKTNTGDFVQPNAGKSEWLFAVARLNPVRVVISIPEVDAAQIDLDKAEVKLSIPTSGPIKITRSSWALEPGSRSLRAEIDLPNKDGHLRPGTYVYAKIFSPCPENWTLPATAVIKQGDTMNCYQQESEGKFIRREVKVGRSDGNSIEILRIQKQGSPAAWEEISDAHSFAVRASGVAK